MGLQRRPQPGLTYTSRKELVVYGNKCLDAYDSGTTNGTRSSSGTAHGGTNQKWNVNTDGTITNVNSGLCLDAYNAATANGTKLVLWTCNGRTTRSGAGRDPCETNP